MTVPIGLATFLVLPDTPYTTKSRFLTPRECRLALERVEKAGKAKPAGVNLNTFKRVLTKWRWYAFVFAYIVCWLPIAISPTFDSRLALGLWRVLPVQRLFWHLAQV